MELIEISIGLAEARLQGVIDFLAKGTTNATVEIYGTEKPVSGADPGGDPLVTIMLVEPFGTVVDGLLNVAPTLEYMIKNTGDAVWARVNAGDGSHAFDCTVTDTAGNGILKVQSVTMYAGGYTRITGGTFA